jgi:hypothetical protein
VSSVVLLVMCLLPIRPPVTDAAPAIKLPAEVKAKPAEITELKVETAGKQVKWVALTPGLSPRPIDSGKTLLFSGPPGRYELLAYTALADAPSDAARCVVLIEGETPPPAPDPLKAKLGIAVTADKAAKADVLQLAAIYREAAKVAADPEVPTSKELLGRVRQVSSALIGPDALPAVRGAVAQELLTVLGMSSEEPLTAAQRRKAADLFARLAAVLEELSK